jgi:hypothetical protein
MPNRWLSLAIVLFWLGMMGWLTGREIWQRFGTRPRLQETLVASAQSGPVHWVISEVVKSDRPLKDGQAPEERPLGTAVTEVRLEGRGGKYRLSQTVHLDRFFNTEQTFGMPLTLELNSKAEVNVFGRLQEMRFRASVPELQVTCDVTGKPHGPNELQVIGIFRLHGAEHRVENTVSYDGTDLILSSLCPLDRMPGLRPGQTWKTPMVDPLETLMSQSFNQPSLLTPQISRPAVAVTVWDQPQGLLWGGKYETCLVVEVVQSGRSMKIFVRQSDGLVLQQTAELGALSPATLAVTRDAKKHRESLAVPYR